MGPQKELLLCQLVLSGILALSQEQSCMVKKLPPFVTSNEPCALLPPGVQVLLPSHQFTCAGRVTRWGVLAEGPRGEQAIHFQIWRPVLPLERKNGSQRDDIPSSFELVGAVSSKIDLEARLFLLQPPESSQIPFEKGDVIGLYIEDSAYGEDTFQVPVHYEEGIESVVLFVNTSRPRKKLEQGELTSQIPGAPVIKVVVEPEYDLLKTDGPSKTTPTIPEATPTSIKTAPTTVMSRPPSTTSEEKSNGLPSQKPTTTTTRKTMPTATPPWGVVPIVIGCAVGVGSVIVVLVVLTVVVMVTGAWLQRRRRKRRPAAPIQPFTHIARGSTWNLSDTLLTENPAYDHTHQGLVASLNWQPKRSGRGKFQLWKAQYYETPISSYCTVRLAEGEIKTEQSSHHHYDSPTLFLNSTSISCSNHYERI